MSRRRVAAAAAAVLLLLVPALVTSAQHAPHPGSGASSPQLGAPGAAREIGGSAPHSHPPDDREQALARAYAAVGAAADGDPHRLDALDALARARVDEARRMLDDAPPRTADEGAAAGAASQLAPRARESGGRTSVGTASASGSGPDAADAAGAMTLDLAHAVDPRRALRDSAEGPELIEPGLWAKVPFRPDERPNLVISDRTAGSYAIAIYGGDFSTLRLDGGLVVPGRFYRVHAQAVITGASAASVDIRPIDTVRGVADQPARIPQGNG